MPERTAEEKKLQHFLYTSREEWSYIAGNPENYGYFSPEKLTSIQHLLQSEQPERVISVIKEVHTENITPRRQNLLYALAVAVANNDIKSKTIKHDLYITISEVIRNDDELFLFAKYLSKLKKSFSSGINKVIAGYYLKKDPMQLVKDVTRHNSAHGWSHKDLIKLSHCKSENILVKIIFTYLLFGFEKCKAIQHESKEATELIKYLSKVEAFKKTTDETTASSLLKELKLPAAKIPVAFHKSPLLWTATIKNMPLQEMLRHLMKFYKMGLLKQDAAIHNKVVGTLMNPDAIKSSGISPLEVFISMKNFERGGKPKDPQLKLYILLMNGKVIDDTSIEVPKCPQVINALHKALQVSYQNLKPMNKRFMVIIDATSKMNEKCLHNRNITCYEAAAFLVTTLLRTEKNVIVCCFTEQSVVQIQLDRGASIGVLIKKFKEHEKEERNYSSAISWAINKKKQVDVFYFINYFTHQLLKCSRQRNLTLQFQKYKTTMGNQARLVRHSLSANIPPLDEHTSDSFQICGFDNGVLPVLEAYSKGLF